MDLLSNIIDFIRVNKDKDFITIFKKELQIINCNEINIKGIKKINMDNELSLNNLLKLAKHGEIISFPKSKNENKPVSLFEL